MIFDDVFMLSIFLFVFLEHYRHMEKQYNILTWIVLFSGRRNMIFACNRPERENKLTIKFQVVSPSPLGFKFQYCNDYYLVGKYSFIFHLTTCIFLCKACTLSCLFDSLLAIHMLFLSFRGLLSIRYFAVKTKSKTKQEKLDYSSNNFNVNVFGMVSTMQNNTYFFQSKVNLQTLNLKFSQFRLWKYNQLCRIAARHACCVARSSYFHCYEMINCCKLSHPTHLHFSINQGRIMQY